MFRTSVRRLVALMVAFSAVFMGVAQPADATPSRFYKNQPYNLGYMGCAFTLHHGQYKGDAFALLRNNGSGTGCQFFYAKVTDTNYQSDDEATPLPANWAWTRALEAGTEASAFFVISGTAYGLQCDVSINVASNGVYSMNFVKVGGTGNCPQQLAW